MSPKSPAVVWARMRSEAKHREHDGVGLGGCADPTRRGSYTITSPFPLSQIAQTIDFTNKIWEIK